MLEAEGHGTDTAVKAFHHDRGIIRTWVPFLKLVASALTIGSGGAAGREGPTALITAGFGSSYAKYARRREADRRLLVLVVAVMRDEDFMLTEPGLRLEANDRPLVICSRSSWDVLAQHVEPIARQRDGCKGE